MGVKVLTVSVWDNKILELAEQQVSTVGVPELCVC